MLWLLLLLIGLLLVGGWWWQKERAARQAQELSDAEAEARRWYDRLGGQVYNLSGDQPAVRQALADAGERYQAAGAQLGQARTAYQFRLARETALEGLLYVRAARVALGIDPGPELPPLAAAQGAGQLTERREVEVEGQTFKAGPDPGEDTPYYYPGGQMQGRRMPAGWYSQPIWKPALAGAAGAMGAMLLFNAMFPPTFGYGAGYGDGYAEGRSDGAGGDDPGDPGADAGGDGSDAGDFGGDFGGGDFGGDFGDFGGF